MNPAAFLAAPVPTKDGDRSGWTDAQIRFHGLCAEALTHLVEADAAQTLEHLGRTGRTLSFSTPDADITLSGTDADADHPSATMRFTALQDMALDIEIPVAGWNPGGVSDAEAPKLAVAVAHSMLDHLRTAEITLNTTSDPSLDLRRWALAHLVRMIEDDLVDRDDRPSLILRARYVHEPASLHVLRDGLGVGCRYEAVDDRPMAPDVGERRCFQMRNDSGGGEGGLRSIHFRPMSGYASHAMLPTSPVEIARILREFDLPKLREVER